jgi:hypothetical protein
LRRSFAAFAAAGKNPDAGQPGRSRHMARKVTVNRTSKNGNRAGKNPWFIFAVQTHKQGSVIRLQFATEKAAILSRKPLYKTELFRSVSVPVQVEA